jgi:glutamate formiminotransferase
MLPRLLECVINVSEGRRAPVLDRLAEAAGAYLLDLHRDPDHHRAVLTLAGPAAGVEAAARAVAAEAVALIDLRAHAGVHPRFGVVDVVPFVALVAGAGGSHAGGSVAGGSGAGGSHAGGSGAGGSGAGGVRLVDGPPGDALAARDRFARWAGSDLSLPCFCYGPERTLPDVRRQAWHVLPPDQGPGAPHPSAGACAVGARPVLVAYNLWLAGASVARARAIAAQLRGPHLRTLGLGVGTGVQVSCNLVAPTKVGPAAVYDAVAERATIVRAELVGLVPGVVLDATDRRRWDQLGLAAGVTIEARLKQAGLDGGRFTGDRWW